MRERKYYKVKKNPRDNQHASVEFGYYDAGYSPNTKEWKTVPPDHHFPFISLHAVWVKHERYPNGLFWISGLWHPALCFIVDMPDLWKAVYENEDITPEEFCALLRAHGFVDCDTETTSED